jgi:hypothetical protein
VKTLELIRIGESKDSTFGVLMDEKIICLTLEDKWHNNEQNVSCIPNGEYDCVKWHSPKFGDTFMVTHVPDRSYILFHWGNTDEDTYGCILVGEKIGEVNGELGIVNSLYTHKKLMEYLTEDFKLIIKG